MAKNLKISTLNVRGLGQDLKRKTLANWLNSHHPSILFLQETHSTDGTIKTWENDFNCEIYSSHGTTKSQGVAILIPRNIPHKVNHKIADVDGRYVILDITIYEETIILASVYFPTKDKEKMQLKLLETLTTKLVQYHDRNIIIAGDFNLSINPILDKPKGKETSKESSKFRVNTNAFLEAFDLNDPIRIKYPNKKLSTWHNKVASTRLDYIMVSSPLLNRISNSKIIPAILTDHDLVKIHLEIPESVVKGPGYWKFNSSYLHNKDYVDLIKMTIKNTATENAKLEDKGLIWDVVKMKIRAASIQFASAFKRNQRSIENELHKALEKLKELSIKDPTDGDIQIAIDQHLIELEQITVLKTKGAIIRAKSKWNEEGEQNTAYFLALEKRNAEDKCIFYLKENEDEFVMDKNAVSDKIYNFYKDLYSENLKCDIDREVSFLKGEFPKLS